MQSGIHFHRSFVGYYSLLTDPNIENKELSHSVEYSDQDADVLFLRDCLNLVGSRASFIAGRRGGLQDITYISCNATEYTKCYLTFLQQFNHPALADKYHSLAFPARLPCCMPLFMICVSSSRCWALFPSLSANVWENRNWISFHSSEISLRRAFVNCSKGLGASERPTPAHCTHV